MVAWGAGPARAGVPYRRLLGQVPLPAQDKDAERFQSGKLRLGYFQPSSRGSAAARPDGTGTGMNLYQLTLLDVLPAQSSGLMADLLFISDRDTSKSYVPTQFNYLFGIGTQSGPWRLQFDREEILPLDRSGLSHRYWDVRLGAVFEADLMGGRRKRRGRRGARGSGSQSRPPGRLRGELTAIYFLHNNTLPARLDNTGLAYARYNARAELGSPKVGLQLFADADFVTDQYKRRWEPSNLDLSLGAKLRAGNFEVAFSRESSDMLDRPGYGAYYLVSFTLPFEHH